MRLSHRLVAVTAAGTLCLAGAAPALASSSKSTKSGATKTGPTKDIIATASAAGTFTTLAKALTAAGLVDTLKGPGPFTVFAPTDAAFAKIPKADLDALLADKTKLAAVLTYHVVAGRVPAANVVRMNGKTAKTVNGATVSIAVKGKQVVLNGTSTVTKTDVLAKNGVIHVIDTVLMPPGSTSSSAAPAAKDIVDTAVSAGNFTTLAKALTAAGLVDTLKGPGPFTVFAPTDAAFAKLPASTLTMLLQPESKATLTKILTSHVVSGSVGSAEVMKLSSAATLAGQSWPVSVRDGKVFIGNAQVTTTDIATSNGIIHVIDTVLQP